MQLDFPYVYFFGASMHISGLNNLKKHFGGVINPNVINKKIHIITGKHKFITSADVIY